MGLLNWQRFSPWRMGWPFPIASESEDLMDQVIEEDGKRAFLRRLLKGMINRNAWRA